MSMRRPRPLTKEDQELWHLVARTASPLHPDHPRPLQPAEKPHPLPRVVKPRVQDFHIGDAVAATVHRHDLAPSIAERLNHAPVHMQRRTYDQMTRGKLVPEARIDLHGMTLAQAHPELTRFILASQARGRRLVLVITGKGKAGDDDGPIPTRLGVLRHQVPHWLAMPPLGAVVLQVAVAHLKHGGTGAYYVYLRRQR